MRASITNGNGYMTCNRKIRILLIDPHLDIDAYPTY